MFPFTLQANSCSLSVENSLLLLLLAFQFPNSLEFVSSTVLSSNTKEKRRRVCRRVDSGLARHDRLIKTLEVARSLDLELPDLSKRRIGGLSSRCALAYLLSSFLMNRIRLRRRIDPHFSRLRPVPNKKAAHVTISVKPRKLIFLSLLRRGFAELKQKTRALRHESLS